MDYLDTKGIKGIGVDYTTSKYWRESTVAITLDLNHLVTGAATGTEVINIGRTCPKVGELTGDLQAFVEDYTSLGTIYIAFGTNIYFDFVPESVIEAFRYAIRQFPEYRIIFAFNGDAKKLGDVPKNVVVQKWAPQKELLNHVKTTLFISHGGLKSWNEAICSKTPILMIPVFAEQTHNAIMAKKLGCADILDKTAVTAEKLTEKIRYMLKNDESFQKTVDKVYDIYTDNMIDVMDLAVHKVNRVMNGKKVSFDRQGKYQTWFTYGYGPHLTVISFLIWVCSK